MQDAETDRQVHSDMCGLHAVYHTGSYAIVFSVFDPYNSLSPYWYTTKICFLAAVFVLFQSTEIRFIYFDRSSKG